MNNVSASCSTSQVFSDSNADSDSAVNFVQDGKTFFPLGGERPICVVPDIFREEVRINIREYFTFPEKDFLYATKRGVNLSIDEFDVLCDNIEGVKQIIKKLKKQVKKASSNQQQQQQKKKNYNNNKSTSSTSNDS